MFAKRKIVPLASRSLGSGVARRRRHRYAPDVAALEDRALLSMAGGAAEGGTHAQALSPSQDTAFVDSLYQTFLDRTPQPAEVQYWNNELAQGLSPTAVENAIANSAKRQGLPTGGTTVKFPGGSVNSNPGGTTVKFPGGSVSSNPGGTTVKFPGGSVNAPGTNQSTMNFVDSLYTNLLDRSPDPQGVAYWSNRIEHGLSPNRVVQIFMSSAEYQQLHGGSGSGNTSVNFPGGAVNSNPGGTTVKFPGGSVNIG